MGTRVALLLAAALAIVAALAARAWQRNAEADLERRQNVTGIVTAARPLRKGDVVRIDNLREALFPVEQLVGDMIPWSEMRRLAGRVLTVNVDEGAPLFRAFLELNRERPIYSESVVASGKRAVTLRVDAEASQAFMIRPGDYVDVVGTFEAAAGELPPELRRGDTPDHVRESMTMRLLESAKVLAVDNRTAAAADQLGAGRAGYRTITLELDPDNAGRLIAAETQGRLTFLLRARGDAAHDGAPLRVYRWQELQR